jgi:T5SS/PEP-CTERM-associated repeat protein
MGPLSSARAAITATGDVGAITTTGVVDPSDPSTWDTSTTGIVGNTSDGTLTVDSGSSIVSGTAYLGYGSGSSGTATVDGVGSNGASTWNTSGTLYVGYSGSGALNITNGGVVNSSAANVGYNSGSTGMAKVDGPGSTWNSSTLGIGGLGGGSSGTLNITNGGMVNTWITEIGNASGSVGVATVNGSTLKASGEIDVGWSGTGTLNIIGGGTVTAGSAFIVSSSLLAIDVGRGSSLSVGNGSGTLTSSGTIRVLAGAGVATGSQYTPISAADPWSDSGTIYQALGGTWNAAAHQFTVSPVLQYGTAGSPIDIDLDSFQRVLVSDSKTGWSVGASFLASDSLSRFTATTISGPNQSVLGAWDFSPESGCSSDDPVYLSFGIGSGYCRDDLEVWQYVGNTWNLFNADDLTYDGKYASFTVTGLGDYAVTAEAVPEPSTLVLLGIGAVSLLAYAWRKRRRTA